MDDDVDYMLDDILGSVEVIAPNLLPSPEPGQEFFKRVNYIRNADGEICGGFDADHWIGKMRMWKRNGEDVEAFISGCIPEWQDDLRKIAREENLL